MKEKEKKKQGRTKNNNTVYGSGSNALEVKSSLQCKINRKILEKRKQRGKSSLQITFKALDVQNILKHKQS